MFNFKARHVFLAGFIVGAIIIALIFLSVLVIQARSTDADESAPVLQEPAPMEPTAAPEEPTRVPEPTSTRAPVGSAGQSALQYALLNPRMLPLADPGYGAQHAPFLI